MVTVDIDTGNVKVLTRQVWKAVARPFLKNIHVEISPSGKGFHIRGENVTEFTDMETRAYLHDDAVRLRYSIKRMALGGKGDICFDVKSYEDGLKYSKDITDLFPLEKMKEMELDEVNELAEKIEKEVDMNETWLTGMRFNGDDLRMRLSEVCMMISDSDETFGFNIYENNFPESDYVLYMYSPTKDDAHKKGMWFLNKVFSDDTPGPVGEKDLEKIVKFDGNYYWTKKKDKK